MKVRVVRWIFALSMLFALVTVCTPADAQVVVAVGQPHHYHHHHRHYHHHPYHH